MALSRDAAEDVAKRLLEIRETESRRLETIHSYLRDDPEDRRQLGGLPADAPPDVQRLARLSRVNVLKYIVSARVQHMYVDGFQTPTSGDNLAQWEAWQRNRFDARQIGVHRAALAFGASYAVILPGTTRDERPIPVIRGASPRELTAAYGDDDEWPVYVLWKRNGDRWRLIDETHVWDLNGDGSNLEVAGEPREHQARYDGVPVCPVVRYRDTDDLDDPVRGIVEPFIALQDQINVTTFGLMVAQHYGAFRQRAIIGWLAETEAEKLKAGASRLWTFEDAPSEIAIWESQQTDLRGYIESREASLRHLATVSQTPAHELMGEMINLSADALEAAKASQQAAVDENRTVIGEAHEQALNLAGEYMGINPDPSATVVWRDTRVRSLSDAALALGLLVEKLGVPPQELWKRVPGVPQHEVERWVAAAQAQADPIEDLARTLDRQAAGTVPAEGE